MATGRSRLLVPWLALAILAPIGCAQPGPFSSRQTMVGSLKASVSQLEFENEKLRKEVGELKADNSRLDTQLAQEREAHDCDDGGDADRAEIRQPAVADDAGHHHPQPGQAEGDEHEPEDAGDAEQQGRKGVTHACRKRTLST